MSEHAQIPILSISPTLISPRNRLPCPGDQRQKHRASRVRYHNDPAHASLSEKAISQFSPAWSASA